MRWSYHRKMSQYKGKKNAESSTGSAAHRDHHPDKPATSQLNHLPAQLQLRNAVKSADKSKSHQLRLLSAKTKYDSGAIPEIILPVIGAVGKLRHKILGLNRTDCKMARHGHINSPSSRHPERGLRPQHNRIRCPHGPQKTLGKWRDPPAPEIHPRSEQI